MMQPTNIYCLRIFHLVGYYYVECHLVFKGHPKRLHCNDLVDYYNFSSHIRSSPEQTTTL